jgi:hypothetical protein
VEGEQASLDSLLHANELRVLNRVLSLVVDVVVNAVAVIRWAVRRLSCRRSPVDLSNAP